MQNKHHIITVASHFFSEAILIFLLTIPYMYFYFHWVPYWSYISIILCLSILFSIYSKYTSSLIVYILTLPLIMFAFYSFQYPILLNIFLTGILSWRFLAIRNRPVGNQEMKCLVLTTLITILLFLLIKDNQIIVYLLIQLIVTLAGHFIGHVTMIHREERKQVNMIFWFYFIVLLGFGALIARIISGPASKALDVLLNLVFLIIGRFVGLFEKFLDGKQFKFEKAEEDSQLEKMQSEDELGPSIFENLAPFVTGYVGIYVLIAICGLVFFIYLFWKRIGRHKRTKTDKGISYTQSNEMNGQERNFIAMLKKSFIRPNHPARRMVYEFERKAAKYQKGRKNFETLEEWFERIGINTDLTIYQKVRYGEANVSDQEVNLLKVQLNEMKNELFK